MVNSMRRERVALKYDLYDFRQQALGMSRRHISARGQLDHITSTPPRCSNTTSRLFLFSSACILRPRHPPLLFTRPYLLH